MFVVFNRLRFAQLLWGVFFLFLLMPGTTWAASCTGENATGATKTGTCVASGSCSGTVLTNLTTSCTDTDAPTCCLASTESGDLDCDSKEGFEEYNGLCMPTSASTGLSDEPIADIVVNFMQWLLYLFGFLAIIAFVVAGILYLTAAGNMNQIEQAKKMMNASILGVIIALGGLVIILTIEALLKASSWV